MIAKLPLEIKGLPVRVTLAGRMGKLIRAEPKGFVAMAGSLLIPKKSSQLALIPARVQCKKILLKKIILSF